jgi:hypothetical protein
LDLLEQLERKYPAHQIEVAASKKKLKLSKPCLRPHSDAEEPLSSRWHSFQETPAKPQLVAKSLSDVLGPWLPPPLSEALPGLCIDFDQEIFYSGASTAAYSQFCLATVLHWSPDQALLALTDEPSALALDTNAIWAHLPTSRTEADEAALIAALWRHAAEMQYLDWIPWLQRVSEAWLEGEGRHNKRTSLSAMLSTSWSERRTGA